MEAAELNSAANVSPASVPGGESILLGPGAAVPAPYFEMRGPDEQAGNNVMLGAVHSVRRRWFAIVVLGLVLGSAAGAGFWFLMATQFTAVARVVVPARESILPVGDEAQDLTDFELKKRSQMQLITSQTVLKSALNSSNVIKLAAVKKLGDEDEQLAWLRSRASVSFPGNAEIMELRVRCPDKDAAIKVAEEIRAQYLKHQVDELEMRALHINSLKDDLRRFKEDYRRKQDVLVGLEERAGSGPPPTPAEQEQARQRQKHWDELNDIDKQIWDLDSALKMIGNSSSGEESLVADEELQTYLETLDEYKSARRRIELLNQDIEKQKTRLSGKAYERFVASTKEKIEGIEEAIAEQSEDVRAQLEFQKRQGLAAASPAQLEQRLSTLKERRAYLDNLIKELTPPEEPGANGPIPYVGIEMARYEAEHIRAMMDRIEQKLRHAELAKLENVNRQQEVGIRLAGEVFLMTDDDERRKLMQSCAAGGAVFMAVSALIVLFDLRRRRLNDTGDVASVLQLNVLGTVPLLRGRGAKRLEESARLAEAVDGVAATLLCRTAGMDHRVVMISSAMAGEGKTTLAANLATSLAAAGRRTLLVDFDLRRPMLHQVYQVPIGPGLGELLSGGDLSDFGEYLQETMTENLWLIPAGARRQAALAALSDERVADLFHEFKEHFEFIIVDGPPVLLVVDTRLVARHADGVVISMLRDVSELPKVKSACQLLQSYRVQILGGVVIGAAGDVYYGYAPERFSSIA